jgi:hypothetical protein
MAASLALFASTAAMAEDKTTTTPFREEPTRAMEYHQQNAYPMAPEYWRQFGKGRLPLLPSPLPEKTNPAPEVYGRCHSVTDCREKGFELPSSQGLDGTDVEQMMRWPTTDRFFRKADGTVQWMPYGR